MVMIQPSDDHNSIFKNSYTPTTSEPGNELSVFMNERRLMLVEDLRGQQ
jgi:hypothetical protein